MKQFVNAWQKVIKEINDAIEHSAEQGLPLSSIELSEEEWDAFVVARTTLAGGNKVPPSSDLKRGSVIYKGIKIYKEKLECLAKT